MKEGLKGEFKSPINGDNNVYKLRIYESLITTQLNDLEFYDENERFALYLGSINTIVIKGK